MATTWKFDLFIDGKWTSGESTEVIDVIDPATEESVGQVPEASTKDAAHAIEAARRAFDEGPWPWMKPKERADILGAMADALDRRALGSCGRSSCPRPARSGQPRTCSGRRLDTDISLQRRAGGESF